jgi:hypothetical protein
MLHYDPNFKADKEVTQGMYTCLKRMVGGDMTMVNKIDGQLEFFKSKQGFFGDEVAQLGLQNKTPAQWWESYGSDQCSQVLAPVRRIARTYELVKAKRASNLFRFVFGSF